MKLSRKGNSKTSVPVLAVQRKLLTSVIKIHEELLVKTNWYSTRIKYREIERSEKCQLPSSYYKFWACLDWKCLFIVNRLENSGHWRGTSLDKFNDMINAIIRRHFKRRSSKKTIRDVGTAHSASSQGWRFKGYAHQEWIYCLCWVVTNPWFQKAEAGTLALCWASWWI